METTPAEASSGKPAQKSRPGIEQIPLLDRLFKAFKKRPELTADEQFQLHEQGGELQKTFSGLLAKSSKINGAPEVRGAAVDMIRAGVDMMAIKDVAENGIKASADSLDKVFVHVKKRTNDFADVLYSGVPAEIGNSLLDSYRFFNIHPDLQHSLAEAVEKIKKSSFVSKWSMTELAMNTKSFSDFIGLRTASEEAVRNSLQLPSKTETMQEISNRIADLKKAYVDLTKFRDGNPDTQLVKKTEETMRNVAFRDYKSVWKKNYSLSDTARYLMEAQDSLGLPKTKWDVGQYGFVGDVEQIPDHLLEHSSMLTESYLMASANPQDYVNKHMPYVKKTIYLLQFLKEGLEDLSSSETKTAIARLSDVPEEKLRTSLRLSAKLSKELTENEKAELNQLLKDYPALKLDPTNEESL